MVKSLLDNICREAQFPQFQNMNSTAASVTRDKFLAQHIFVLQKVCQSSKFKVTVDLQRPNFMTFFFFAHNTAKTSIKSLVKKIS